jgi:hypothetical protein
VLPRTISESITKLFRSWQLVLGILTKISHGQCKEICIDICIEICKEFQSPSREIKSVSIGVYAPSFKNKVQWTIILA